MRRLTIFWYPLQSVLVKRGKILSISKTKEKKKSHKFQNKTCMQKIQKNSSDQFYNAFKIFVRKKKPYCKEAKVICRLFFFLVMFFRKPAHLEREREISFSIQPYIKSNRVYSPGTGPGLSAGFMGFSPACFLVPETMSSILSSKMAVSMAVFRTCALTANGSQMPY